MERKDYVVNVGPNGTFKKSGDYQTLPEHLDAMFEQWQAQQPQKIAIYFHGGLINEKNGLESANKMQKHFEAIGVTPACFVWETGLMETILTNLDKIKDTALFEKLMQLIIKKVGKRLGFDLAMGRGDGVEMTNEEIEAELAKPIPFAHYDRKTPFTVAAGRGRSPIEDLADDISLERDLERDIELTVNENEAEYEFAIQNSPVALPNDGQGVQGRGLITMAKFIKEAVQIALKVIQRYIKKRDHNFIPTIVEEILRHIYIADFGAFVWNGMKLKSEKMWMPHPPNATPLGRHVGRYFLEKLAAFKSANPATRIDLVGHSAGSIAICNMLKAAAKDFPQLTFGNILLMAPACRIDLFHAEIVTKPERFAGLRIFTMKDDLETKDKLLWYFYPHSLLYLVSGILEDEGKSFDAYILGLDRHINGEEPYNDIGDEAEQKVLTEVHRFIYEAGKNRIVFSDNIDGGDGMRSQSYKHGDFDDDVKYTIPSIQYILQQ
jgi:hypothetical protein